MTTECRGWAALLQPDPPSCCISTMVMEMGKLSWREGGVLGLHPRGGFVSAAQPVLSRFPFASCHLHKHPGDVSSSSSLRSWCVLRVLPDASFGGRT